MSSAIELPLCIDASDKVASLDDILGTLKVTYTVTACSQCGRMVMLGELTRPSLRQPISA